MYFLRTYYYIIYGQKLIFGISNVFDIRLLHEYYTRRKRRVLLDSSRRMPTTAFLWLHASASTKYSWYRYLLGGALRIGYKVSAEAQRWTRDRNDKLVTYILYIICARLNMFYVKYIIPSCVSVLRTSRIYI